MRKLVALCLMICLLFVGCKPKVVEKTIDSNESESMQEETMNAQIEDEKNQEEISPEIELITGTPKEIAAMFFEYYRDKDYDKIINNFQYDKAAKAQLSKDSLVSAWDEMIAPNGEFVEIIDCKTNSQVELEIVGMTIRFTEGSIVFSVVFNENKEIAGFNILPYVEEGVLPDTVKEYEVSFGEAGSKLPATLTLPMDQENCKVVILVHGPGANDRDETIGVNKPFRDIAWQLAQMGIGVLRYEKRENIYPNKFYGNENATVYDETINDVKLAYEFLKTYDEVKMEDIYILGHNFGGYLIPRIAQEIKEAAGFILLAGSARPLEDLIVEQLIYISNIDGTMSQDEQFAIDYYKKLADLIKNIDTNTEYSKDQLMGKPKSYWLDLKGYNPIEMMKIVEQPILILQGDRDYQVTLTDFNIWEDGLNSKDNVTFKLYEGLNHLFIKGTGKSTPEEYNEPSIVSSDVTSDIALWIMSK